MSTEFTAFPLCFNASAGIPISLCHEDIAIGRVLKIKMNFIHYFDLDSSFMSLQYNIMKKQGDKL